MQLTLFLSLCVAILAARSAAGPCLGLASVKSILQVHQCLDELLGSSAFGPDMQDSLRKAMRHAEAGREACTATEQQASMLGCRELSDLTYNLLAEGAVVLWQCQAAPETCTSRGSQASQTMLLAWQGAEMTHRHLPTASMVSSKLTALMDEVLGPLLQEGTAASELNPAVALAQAPLQWRVATKAADELQLWLQGYIWRETHWLWLMDSLQANKVVHTTWGSPEEWNDKFGTHDCDVEAPLAAAGPRYLFNDLSGMRWELLATLLRDLWMRRGSQEPLVLVEIGVFAGMLAHHLLKELDFIVLIGVDPYIGSDGTFPGNFSDSLDPDIAMYKAMSVMEPYGQRAQLVTMSSEDAAAQIGAGEVDVVFVDGCHLYDCVRQDFDLWIPKLRKGVETLVVGHDFSPQWPGVVRAVHERRAGGQQVNLASDWLFWWHESLT